MTKRLLWILGSACLMAAPGSASAQSATAPTWNKDVAPIVYANCITCHRPGEVAPMSLLTYADARPWARGIKAKVMAHEMPPWFADPRYGKFQNKRGLTQAQVDTLIAWADGGAPQGARPVGGTAGAGSAVASMAINDAIIPPLPPACSVPDTLALMLVVWMGTNRLAWSDRSSSCRSRLTRRTSPPAGCMRSGSSTGSVRKSLR